ncbi:MAG: zinc-dependent alcohol dehydrogenase family protein [Pyrinomonadaceae bacterium]|nr:zinc-dependent alcohol dehydrogenase family protein [Pyrinomonadaceae bacterium]
MQAYVLERPAPIESRPLELVEIDLPELNPGQVLVQISACGLCRTDLHVCEGDLEPRLPKVIPGHQIVGHVARIGDDVTDFRKGERVGIAWLHQTCGTCSYCLGGNENLCDDADFTGWTVNGGFAGYAIASGEFLYRLPEDLSDTQAAPLLCAGIIGFRALNLTGLPSELHSGKIDWTGARLGIYGFGAAGHISIQLALARGAEVYVATRDRKTHQSLAEELGAVWVGDTFVKPPVKLDAAIIFAPAGEIVPAALKALDKAGCLVLGGIHMSPIPEFEYKLLYGERVIRSVTNNTRTDGQEFLQEAARAKIRTHTETFHFEELAEALIALKHDAIRGAAVVSI